MRRTPSRRQSRRSQEDVAGEHYLLRAVELARKGCGHTRPNPPVGAVIVSDGEVIGEGYHKKAGTDHAEVAAIKDAISTFGSSRARELFSNATLYVTLEPCSQPGRVGACTDAIAESGIRHVVYGVQDPNPTNGGRSREVLAQKGVFCEPYLGNVEVTRYIKRFLTPFARHVFTGLPYVTVKIAMSLDGRIRDDRGEARWVSSDDARQKTGKIREEVDAIMVGAETIRRDNPSLLCHTATNDDLIRVVVSRSGNLPKDAQVFTDGKNETLVFADAEEAVRALGRRGCLHVLCEGGLKLATSLAEAGLVDEWLTVLSPCVIGSRPIANPIRFVGGDVVRCDGDGDLIAQWTRKK